MSKTTYTRVFDIYDENRKHLNTVNARDAAAATRQYLCGCNKQLSNGASQSPMNVWVQERGGRQTEAQQYCGRPQSYASKNGSGKSRELMVVRAGHNMFRPVVVYNNNHGTNGGPQYQDPEFQDNQVYDEDENGNNNQQMAYNYTGGTMPQGNNQGRPIKGAYRGDGYNNNGAGFGYGYGYNNASSYNGNDGSSGNDDDDY